MKYRISLKFSMLALIPIALITFWASRVSLSHRDDYLGQAEYHHRRLLEELNIKNLLGKPDSPQRFKMGKKGLALVKTVNDLRINYHKIREDRFRITAYYPWRSINSDDHAEPGDDLLWETQMIDPMSDPY